MDNELDIQEYIRIIYKRRRLLIAFIFAAVIASAGISFMMEPVYEASTMISLGKFNSTLYTNTTSAKEIVLSDEVLMDVINKLVQKNEVKNPSILKSQLTVKDIQNTSLLKITAKASKPDNAKFIAEQTASSFLQKINKLFNENIKKYQEELNVIAEQQKTVNESLLRNKALLFRFQEENSENTLNNDFRRNDLFEIIKNDEKQLLELHSRASSIKREMLSLEKPVVINNALIPKAPVKPNKSSNILMAAIIGLVIGLVSVFIMEYFSRNPLNLKEQN